MKASKMQEEEAIIVMGGAFSPVHCGHVAAMEAAFGWAQEYLQVKVVAGYLACATNSYTSHKYGARAIKGQARLEMCNLVNKDHRFLCETPVMYGSARQCGEAMIKANHHPNTRLLVVCGADKAGGGKKTKRDHIYMARSSHPAPGLVPTPEATAHVSATLVRETLGKAPSFEAGVEQLLQAGMITDAVAGYMTSNAAAFSGIILAAEAAPKAAAQAALQAAPQVAPQAASRKGRRWAKTGTKDASAVRPMAEMDANAEAPLAGSSASSSAPLVAEAARALVACSRPLPADGKMRMIFDMETGDPDDVLTLLLLCSHPAVDLCAVTVTPGSWEQLSLVMWLLQQVGMSDTVRLGAQDWPNNADKPGCTRGNFYDSFGRVKRQQLSVESADRVLLECCDANTTLLTGGPLHNLGAALSLEGFTLGRWVAQGGFAGEGVVPRRLQMDKFLGKKSCPTWNFGGNVQAAEAALANPSIGRRVLVSKNVCHRVVYDAELHEAIRSAAEGAAASHNASRATALRLIFNAMEQYQKEKKLHDPLALATALDESVCTLAEVRVFREKTGWGSCLQEWTNTWISVDYDDTAFKSALLGRMSPPHPNA